MRLKAEAMYRSAALGGYWTTSKLSRVRRIKNYSCLSEYPAALVDEGLHRGRASRSPERRIVQISKEVVWRRIGYADDLPFAVRGFNTRAILLAREAPAHQEPSGSDLSRQEEDVFDSITDKLPEPPVSVAEGASYGVVVLLGLAVAGSAAYAVFKELIFEPKEYKVFGKSLDRVQAEDQVLSRLGSPITGYGQETRNRAARQRISNRAWTDEGGVDHVEVMFYIRGPGGAGKVYSEMFRDPEDKAWKYTYLIVDVGQPFPTRLMLESYVPPLAPSALDSSAAGSKEAVIS